MSNLILLIISILLIAVVSGATLYYGGDKFEEGASDAKASTVINQLNMTQSAGVLFKVREGATPTNMAELFDGKYLKDTMKVPFGDGSDAYSIAEGQIALVGLTVAAKSADGITLDICESINENGNGLAKCGADAATPGFENVDHAAAPTAPTAAGETAHVWMAL